MATKHKGPQVLYCFMCVRWVEGRQLSGGWYCPHCSGYLQLKNQPPKPKPSSTEATGTPEAIPPSKTTSGGRSGVKAGGNRG